MDYSTVGMKVCHIKKLCRDAKVHLFTGDGTSIGCFEGESIPSIFLERYVASFKPDIEGDDEWVIGVELVSDTIKSVVASAIEEEFDSLRMAYLNGTMFGYEISEAVYKLLSETDKYYC